MDAEINVKTIFVATGLHIKSRQPPTAHVELASLAVGVRPVEPEQAQRELQAAS
jgi:hypothetical protein